MAVGVPVGGVGVGDGGNVMVGLGLGGGVVGVAVGVAVGVFGGSLGVGVGVPHGGSPKAKPMTAGDR